MKKYKGITIKDIKNIKDGDRFMYRFGKRSKLLGYLLGEYRFNEVIIAKLDDDGEMMFKYENSNTWFCPVGGFTLFPYQEIIKI